jgi:hypothetical protein
MRALPALLVATLLAAAPSARAQTALEPVAPGAEGRRAFDDLAAFYAEKGKKPDVGRAIDALGAKDEAKRRAAAAYVEALLAQSLADERNGRAPWRRLPFWGGGSESDAREIRKEIAAAVGERAAGEGALGPALWLVREDPLAADEVAGMKALRRVPGPRALEAIGALLAGPAPNAAVLVGAIEEAAARGAKDLAPRVRPLCNHYRAAVRAAARAAAPALGIGELPELRPEDALAPLEPRLRAIAAMVATDVPAGAPWKRFRVKAKDGEGERSFSGFLLGEADGKLRVLDLFADEISLARDEAEVGERAFAEDAELLLAARKESAAGETPFAGMGVLSRRGGLTGQFEPRFLSLPEALLAAWSLGRGDRETAAAVILPRMDAMDDDRWLGEAARDLLGHRYHQDMLEAFSERDYPRALALARHLASPAFDGYGYQERAKELARELARRGDDFRGFRLPTPEEWTKLRATLGRADEVRYLAERLRLLNCRQWGQPGGVSYEAPQTAEPAGATGTALAVVNPYTELRAMKLAVADLPALVPFLGDESFMPTFSYWRDFHPARTLHQANWAVAEIVNEAAHRDLAALETFSRLDAEGKRAHIERILAWCRKNAAKTRADLILGTMRTTGEWREFEVAAGEAVRDRIDGALPVLVSRSADFAKERPQIARLAYALDADAAAEPARRWLRESGDATRFWAALILLAHGDRARVEGLAELRAALEADASCELYPLAIDPLLATKNEEALRLADGILAVEAFGRSWNRGPVLERLVLAGREAALRYTARALGSDADAGTTSGEWKGERVERRVEEGDRAAEIVAGWRGGGFAFEPLAPEGERRARRAELSRWLGEEFARIRAGTPTMKAPPAPIGEGVWRLDAP